MAATSARRRDLQGAVTEERTRFVGVRGLMKQKLEAADTATAPEAGGARLCPAPQNHQNVAENADECPIRSCGCRRMTGWVGARKTLGAKLTNGSVPRDVPSGATGCWRSPQAREAERRATRPARPDRAIEANRLSPDLILAAVMSAGAHIDQGASCGPRRGS